MAASLTVIPQQEAKRTSPDAPPLPPATWLIAARSEELGAGGPIGRIVNGVPVVLYRDQRGRPVALEDRCPHKNVALSLGQVRGDTLQCRYHGWRFEPSGCVVDVPCHSPDERPPACRVRAFAAVERDDWIWVNLAGLEATATEPPVYPKQDGYSWFELQYLVRAPVDLILENGLDCSHTGFAHEGLFRSAPKQFITARIEETPTGVRVETRGEDSQGADDVRGVLGRKQSIRHIDEVILPHTLRVDYWIGETTHIVTILVCTPEDDGTTRVYNRMGVRYRWLTPLVAWYVRRLTRRVVAQDITILDSQAERIRRFGRREFRNVSADVPAAWLQRAYRLFAEGRYPGEQLRVRDVVYKL